MAGLATDPKQTGVTEAEHNLAVRPGCKLDHCYSSCLSSELINTVAKFWKQSKERRFDGISVGTASASEESLVQGML